jgi:hypothetical protein
MKKQLPLLIGFFTGMFAVAEFYIPAQGVHDVMTFLLEIGSVLAAAAYVLGGINLIQFNLPIIKRRRPDWEYKIVLLFGAAAMALAGIRWHELGDEPTPGTLTISEGRDYGGTLVLVKVSADQERYDVQIDGVGVSREAGEPVWATVPPGRHTVFVKSPDAGYTDATFTFDAPAGSTVSVSSRLVMKWGPEGRVFTWLYDHVFAPANATMFALLAFFIASAAFRAFRARNVESALLLGAAILVMIGLVPIGRLLWDAFPEIADWILEVPNNAGRRAIIMGAALGVIATSLRVILGIERSHLGRE